MNLIKQIIVSSGVLTVLLGGALVVSTPTYAAGITCTVLPQSICDGSDAGDLESSSTWLLVIYIVNILSGAVGLAAVAMIAYAAFLYTTAQSDEGQTKKAKEMIRNAAIGIVAYALMWAAIQWLVPGGVFN